MDQVSTSQDHIIGCKLDSVLHIGVCMCRCGECNLDRVWAAGFGPNDLPRQFWGDKPPTQFRHR